MILRRNTIVNQIVYNNNFIYSSMPETQQILSFANKFAVLGLTGFAMTASNPFDLVRIRMQTMPEMIDLGYIDKAYKGITDCFTRVCSEQGRLAIFKGNGANLLRFYSSESINYFSKEEMKKFIRNNLSEQYFSPLQINFAAGASASWISRGFLYPIEYARNILARNTGSQNQSIFGCLKETIKTRGISEIYRGSLISFLGAALYRGISFGIFDTMKGNMNGELQRWGLAYFSSMMAILASYPTDTIRRRLMCSSKNRKYNGFMDCCSKMYSRQGIKSFFRGAPIIFFQSLSASGVLYSFDNMCRNQNV